MLQTEKKKSKKKMTNMKAINFILSLGTAQTARPFVIFPCVFVFSLRMPTYCLIQFIDRNLLLYIPVLVRIEDLALCASIVEGQLFPRVSELGNEALRCAHQPLNTHTHTNMDTQTRNDDK